MTSPKRRKKFVRVLGKRRASVESGGNERIGAPADCNPPITHGAVRVRLCDLGECIEALRIPEIVQHGEGAIKFLLSGRNARHGKVDLSQPFGISHFLLRRQHGCRRKHHEDQG